jgi:hypothetical protein
MSALSDWLDNPNIPADTKRRLRYATFEQIDEHGRIKHVHDPQIREGRISAVSTDRGKGVVSRDVTEASVPAPTTPARDASGRFAKASES